MNGDRGGPRPLVIGVGNRDRGDDAVGPLVVDELALRHDGDIECMVVDGDLSDLVLRWQPEHCVVIVDAMVSGRRPGTIVEIDCLERALEPQSGLLSSHGVGLSDAVELARVLRLMPNSLLVLAVEAEQFVHGAPLSEPVAHAADEVLERLSRRHLQRLSPEKDDQDLN